MRKHRNVEPGTASRARPGGGVHLARRIAPASSAWRHVADSPPGGSATASILPPSAAASAAARPWPGIRISGAILGQRHQHEQPLVRARMGRRQPRRVAADLFVQQQVQVERARRVAVGPRSAARRHGTADSPAAAAAATRSAASRRRSGSRGRQRRPLHCVQAGDLQLPGSAGCSSSCASAVVSAARGWPRLAPRPMKAVAGAAALMQGRRPGGRQTAQQRTARGRTSGGHSAAPGLRRVPPPCGSGPARHARAPPGAPRRAGACVPVQRPALPQPQPALHVHRLDLCARGQAHQLPAQVPAGGHLRHVEVDQQEVRRQPDGHAAGDAAQP